MGKFTLVDSKKDRGNMINFVHLCTRTLEFDKEK